jgi:Cu-Zn family superoxide dismutase
MSARTVASLLFALAGCAGAPARHPIVVTPVPISALTVVSANEERVDDTLTEVTIAIRPSSGSAVSGQAVLTRTSTGVRVAVEVQSASPGLHGLHVHQLADCSAADARSAGEHFNPDNQAHGLPIEDVRHLGDLGNLSVAADGTGRLVVDVPGAVLAPGAARSLLGRAIVVNAEADDGSERAAQGGDRVGCGEVLVPPASR